MTKKITYEGKEYTAEIKWGGNGYFIRVIECGRYVPIEPKHLNVIGAIKALLKKSIENTHDLTTFEEWDGKMD